jgi:hypothetical protein
LRCFQSSSSFSNNDDNVDDPNFQTKNPKSSLQKKDDLLGKAAILIAPAFMSALAFASYKDTSQFFHDFVDFASGHTWAPVDRGAYLTDLISPALNGPVGSFVSLLFGTLTSMTVSTLFQRQASMARILSELLEDLRLIQLHVQYFPPEYREPALAMLNDYNQGIVQSLNDPDLLSDKTLQQRNYRDVSRKSAETLMMLLHEMSHDDDSHHRVPDSIKSEAYGTLNRIIRLKSSLTTTYDNQFPIWHYGNLAVLALAISIIFLVMTDRTALQFLGGFQLRLCWAMLIGTFSMLAVVIYDLSTPLSGAFQVRTYSRTKRKEQKTTMMDGCAYLTFFSHFEYCKIAKPRQLNGLQIDASFLDSLTDVDRVKRDISKQKTKKEQER